MSALARPALLASVLSAAALSLHPALRASVWLPERDLLLAALLLLMAGGLVARALAAVGAARVPAWLVALGMLAVVAGLAGDGLRGRHGLLRLTVGQASNNFDETGPGGRSLGLRPLGFSVAVERAAAAGTLALVVPGRPLPVELAAGRAAAIGGYRFAQPVLSATGGAARLRVSATDGTRTDVAEVAPGRPGRAGDLVISLDEYFPDFALDDKQQPFTRSLEPRNPAALLTVERGAERHRAFVIQAMPGVHRIEALGRTFSLLDVEPEQQVEIAVHREPLAPVVLLGGVLGALGIGLGAIRRGEAGRPASSRAVPPLGARVDDAAIAGAVYALALLLVDDGRLLGWSFGVSTPGGREPLPGVGVLLGLSLLAAVAGALWLTATALAGAAVALSPGRAALWLAVATGASGLLLAVVRVVLLPETTVRMALPLAGLALAIGLLALALRGPADALSRLLTAGVVLAGLAAVAAGLAGLNVAGTYAVAGALAAAAATLLGLAALEQTGLGAVRRLVFLVALLALLVRPS
jgi:hypothetical protein